jgi:hypothetical protein
VVTKAGAEAGLVDLGAGPFLVGVGQDCIACPGALGHKAANAALAGGAMLDPGANPRALELAAETWLEMGVAGGDNGTGL